MTDDTWTDLGHADSPIPEARPRPTTFLATPEFIEDNPPILGVDFGTGAWAVVDERHGRPARVEAMPRPVEYLETTTRPWEEVGPRLRNKGRVVRSERYVLRDEAALWLSSDDLRRTLAAAADELARRLFADTPLALSSIIRTSIVPWDIEYQTTTDGTSLERVTRLVEYERGARRG